jgi:inorganic phosphate transporter, PiT family
MHITAGLVVVVTVALAFDFFNGFHDAANSIATVVSTRVLTPLLAVLWAAFFNFIAWLILGTKVAATIAKDVVDPHFLSLSVVFAGLIGAIAWDIFTWYLGLPTSSSHALIGGLAGAAVAAAGWHSLLSSGFRKIAVFIVLSPVIGLLLAFTVMVAVMWAFHRVKRQDRLNRGFKATSLLSAAAFSLGHGANDAQKTMGLILAVLIAERLVPTSAGVPLWVVLAAQLAMGLGTAFGGWRIIRTMGSRITKITPAGGMSAQAAGAAVLFFTAANGIPVSTTHTITGAIVGVGSVQRLSAVRWGVAGRVVWAWILTIPGAFIVAWLVYLPFKLF